MVERHGAEAVDKLKEVDEGHQGCPCHLPCNETPDPCAALRVHCLEPQRIPDDPQEAQHYTLSCNVPDIVSEKECPGEKHPSAGTKVRIKAVDVVNAEAALLWGLVRNWVALVEEAVQEAACAKAEHQHVVGKQPKWVVLEPPRPRVRWRDYSVKEEYIQCLCAPQPPLQDVVEL